MCNSTCSQICRASKATNSRCISNRTQASAVTCYEVITLKNGHVLIVIGDVSGHGMQAALVVATALKTLRFLARTTTNMSQPAHPVQR